MPKQHVAQTIIQILAHHSNRPTSSWPNHQQPIFFFLTPRPTAPAAACAVFSLIFSSAASLHSCRRPILSLLPPVSVSLLIFSISQLLGSPHRCLVAATTILHCQCCLSSHLLLDPARRAAELVLSRAAAVSGLALSPSGRAASPPIFPLRCRSALDLSLLLPLDFPPSPTSSPSRHQAAERRRPQRSTTKKNSLFLPDDRMPVTCLKRKKKILIYL